MTRMTKPQASNWGWLNYYGCVKCFALATTLVCFFILAACNGNRPPKINEKAPDFTLTDSERTVSLAQLRGKPVLLNFWATWCPPCIEEMPSLVQLQKEMGHKVTILAVSEDADDGAYKQFVRDHNIDLLTVRDPRNTANTLYGTFKFPETYVIDKDGVIRRKFIGPAVWTSPEMIDYLNKLQEGKS
jgi:cytochrome c biogenesis protein CcmG, thiol:disulfide interchange protein DsbE